MLERLHKKDYFKTLSVSFIFSFIGILGLLLIMNSIRFDNFSKLSAVETLGTTFGFFILSWAILNPAFSLYALVAKKYH
ncbi:MAG: hypothetical protein GY696_00705 [Gammaproteobacteria bacterium]|nr:hypothetical protein [Gammaproteobacteria bacterium]